MFRTQWIPGISGTWYQYTLPTSFQSELTLISILGSTKDIGEIASLIMSEILQLPPPVVDVEFYSDQIWDVFKSVFPNLESSEVPQKAKVVQSDLESKDGDPIAKMLAFLARHGNLQPSEILRLPRATVDAILRELVELLEVDKKFELELSVVNALGKLFGGSESTESTPSSSPSIKGKDVVDLTNIDPSDITQFSLFEGVEVR